MAVRSACQGKIRGKSQPCAARLAANLAKLCMILPFHQSAEAECHERSIRAARVLSQEKLPTLVKNHTLLYPILLHTRPGLQVSEVEERGGTRVNL